ncbi:MAG: GNAT family N-acetyltransferase [archaeon]|nr:GNAT family N-acetyltransferase [Nanoarchaeota archaeon]
MTIDIHIAQNKTEIEEVLKIRKEVFIKGQNVPIYLEKDGLDESSEHAILYCDNVPTGCARIRYINGSMRLERIAILEQMQGKKLGSKLVNFLIEYGEEKGVREINMHAQYHLLEFYKRFGLEQRGEPFYEIDTKHIEMALEY